MEVKKALITFHYTERIKSSLILASDLLEVASSTRGDEAVGAERLFTAFLNALMKEVAVAVNASGVKSFQEVNLKLEEAIRQVREHDYPSVRRLISEAITLTTTSGSWAAQMLKDEGLI